MKQYLLFAGVQSSKVEGVNGFVEDFDTVAEAFLHIIDHQIPAEWWHVLDTRTSGVIDRRHVRVSNGMIGFQRSEWIVGTPANTLAIAAPSAKAAALTELEADLRSVVANGVRNGSGQPAHANGKSADH